MSQYPPPPQPPQPPPPPHQPWGGPPPPPPPPHTGIWVAVAAGVLVLLVGVFAVTAFAAPGFLVDDDSDDSSASASDDTGDSQEHDEGEAGEDPPPGAPEIEIPPPNAAPSDPSESELPTLPSVPEVPEAPELDPDGFAENFLAMVADGDAAGVDEAMCAEDQEAQYEDAVGEGLALTTSNPQPDASTGGILSELVGPEGTLDGRLLVVPDDTSGWCVETFYVF